ncbi:MAG TPA: hypothetical protein VF173_16745 [Thermoanaerobaculia bacterium]|nr:hypothetical protein [Thermoanaerobaculia bacterium]
MTEAEAVAQAQLDIVVGVLKIARQELQKIALALPHSPQEFSHEDHTGEPPDVTNEVRRVIQCVLADRLDGAVRELSAAAIYRPVVVEPESGTHGRQHGKGRRKKKAGKARAHRKNQGQGRGGA